MNAFALFRNALWTACLSIALFVLFCCTRSASAQSSPPIFPVPTQISLPSDSFVAFAGDFNGDGIPDLAYTTTVSNSPVTLSIMLSFGSSAPTTKTMTLCPIGTNPLVNFADVNNDKKLDLIFYCNGYLTIQLGNSDGTFQTPAYFPSNPIAPVFVDLNGDGYLDIAGLLAGAQANTPPQVAVYINHGAAGPGVFASPKLYPAPSSAAGLAAGDFNGDGKQDLLTTTYTTLPVSTGFSVLYGNGDGTLNPGKAQSTASFSGFTVGDFNGDGVTDVALLLLSSPNSLYTSVQILLGSTSGTFTPGASLPLVATAGSTAGYFGPLTTAALTTDGNLDLIVTTSVLNIFHGDGKGNFTPTGSYSVGFAAYPPSFADVNQDGKQDLILANPAAAYIFPGNGDGTFQAPPATAVYGSTADVNNDGIADMVFLPPLGGNLFGTALGRGDGTFAILDQTTPLPAAPSPYLLMLGDFNGDGKIDTLAIYPGSFPPCNGCAAPKDAQLLSYLGSGDGRFQAKGTALALGVSFAEAGIIGDFNSDGKLDLILPYSGLQEGQGLLLVPGNGDGTFGAPINLNTSQSSQPPNLLVGDLNNDKKLDFISGDAVFLGNGDGTFKQIPLNIPASPAGTTAAIAIADLNGDGILDAVSQPGTLYAGKGDGTFQTTPFYTLSTAFLAAGDVNGDGYPDLLATAASSAFPNSPLTAYLGDGHGNFTPDTNTYLVSIEQSGAGVTPTRLNNQAPALPGDSRLDLLIALNGDGTVGNYVSSLLNQTNPAPAKPTPLTSTTGLQASPATATPGAAVTLTASVFGTNPTGSVSFSANGNDLGTEAVVNGTATIQTSFANTGSYTATASYEGDSNNTASTSSAVGITITPATSATTLQATPSAGNVNGQITLKASVSGDSPSGSVSFSAGSTSLGTATLTNGVATLQTSFAAAGSFATTATYQGDQNNAASTSTAITIVIAAPDFTVTATPTSGTVPPGQTATFTFTVTPAGGYSGTVKFSCGPLPAQAACSFSPASVAPSGSSPASSTLTVTTVAATTALNPKQPSMPSLPPWIPAGGLAIAGAMGIAFAPRKIKRWNRGLRLLSWGLLLAAISVSVLGCGGGNSSPSTPATTPAGSYAISVNATDSAGGPQHAVSVALLVQ